MGGLLKKLNRANRERHRGTYWDNVNDWTGEHRSEMHSYTHLNKGADEAARVIQMRAEARVKTNEQVCLITATLGRAQGGRNERCDRSPPNTCTLGTQSRTGRGPTGSQQGKGKKQTGHRMTRHWTMLDKTGQSIEQPGTNREDETR